LILFLKYQVMNEISLFDVMIAVFWDVTPCNLVEG
jgi:hypothetical protein